MLAFANGIQILLDIQESVALCTSDDTAPFVLDQVSDAWKCYIPCMENVTFHAFDQNLDNFTLLSINHRIVHRIADQQIPMTYKIALAMHT